MTFVFKAAFEDVYAVRQLLNERPGKLRAPRRTDDAITFRYDGADGVQRVLAVRFSPSPGSARRNEARFQLKLEPREKKQLAVAVCIAESKRGDDIAADVEACLDPKAVYRRLKTASETWLGSPTGIESDSLALNSIMQRSLRDARMLHSTLEKEHYICAGVPWFGALFGRDSLVASLQMLAFAPALAKQTLELLAKHQGSRVDHWREEEPGKILHEFRVGELANLREIPHTPYYGTVDATLLFLILIGRYTAWTGDLSLFRELHDHVTAALHWMQAYGDRNRDGYIEYESKSKKGLVNHGWKDSGDAIVNEDGSLAEPPIALVEVQAYAYMAKREIAALYNQVGESERAVSLQREAEEQRERFNRDFWLPEKGIYALALQAGGKPAAVVSSNTAHALWSEIAEPEKAKQIAERIMADDMFSGWGVRTLSKQERRYNPVGYHLGSVWPHDNSIIASGLRRYGFDDFSLRIFAGMIEAARHFGDGLPELFSGFARSDYGVPVRYPVACHPQAWAAATVPHLLETVLGLTPEGLDGRLRIVRPILPDFVDRLEIHHLKVARVSLDLRFERRKDHIVAEVLQLSGPLDVVIEPG
jgi:glycogen debranching enzyme